MARTQSVPRGSRRTCEADDPASPGKSPRNRSRKGRRRGGLLPRISRELKAPLTSIRSASQAVARARTGALSRKQERMLRIITEESAALVCLIEDLLDMAEIESGKLALKFRCCSLTEVGRAALDRQRPRFRQKGVELLDSLPALCPAVRADAARLRQVFDHLLSNALKFTPAGGRVEVKLRRERSCSDPPALQELLIGVIDTGEGIPRQDLQRLFAAPRTDPYGSPRAGGADGLGLSLAKFLVEAHGGQIWAESGPGPGSSFFFTLPIAR